MLNSIGKGTLHVASPSCNADGMSKYFLTRPPYVSRTGIFEESNDIGVEVALEI